MSKVKKPFYFKKENNQKRKDVKPSKTGNNIILLDSVPEPDFDMKYRKITPELLKYFSMTVRRTPEYKSFIQFVKNFLDVSQCSFYEDYSMKNGFTIELHHHPFSLYDICEAVANKQMKKNNYVETFRVLEEVLLLHYKFMVGLTPLNPTAHDLVHSEVLKVHPAIIIGEWRKLYNEYLSYLSKTAINKYDALFAVERDNKNAEFPKILEMNRSKLVIKGMTNVIDEKTFNKLMIENKIKQVDKITYKGGAV
jgi:hypothetical protein